MRMGCMDEHTDGQTTRKLCASSHGCRQCSSITKYLHLNDVSKKSWDERLTRGVAGFPIVSSAYLLNQRLVVVSIKWHGAMNHGVQQHTKGPGVHLWPTVWPTVDNLWGGVQRATAKGLKILITMVEVRQAKVCNLR